MNLRKSHENILFTGLLGGIGEYYQIDPTLIRIVFALLTWASAFPMIPLYIIAALIVPKGSPNDGQSKKKNQYGQIIDKNLIHPHNMDSLSERREIEEVDWSDF